MKSNTDDHFMFFEHTSSQRNYIRSYVNSGKNYIQIGSKNTSSDDKFMYLNTDGITAHKNMYRLNTVSHTSDADEFVT